MQCTVLADLEVHASNLDWFVPSHIHLLEHDKQKSFCLQCYTSRYMCFRELFVAHSMWKLKYNMRCTVRTHMHINICNNQLLICQNARLAFLMVWYYVHCTNFVQIVYYIQSYRLSHLQLT